MVLKAEHGDIHYEERGDKDAPPLIFSHGRSHDLKTFVHQAEHFQKTHRVILWDLPDHGKTTIRPFTFARAAEAMVALLDHLAIERAVHVGVSLGGFLGQYMAIHKPERIAALVDIAAMPIYGSLSKRQAKTAAFFMRLIMPLFPNRFFAWASAKKMAYGGDLETYVREQSLAFGKKRLLQTNLELMRELSRDHPHAIEKKTIIIHGEKDGKVLIEKSGKWADEEHVADHVLIEKAGHLCHQQQPTPVNRVIEGFLASLDET